MKKYYFALLLCFQISLSQNVDHLDTVLKQLGIKKSEINTELLAQKILPYDKGKSVLAIPKYSEKVEDEYSIFDAYIVVIDNSTGKIICKFIEPGAWTSDAVRLEEISIDTGLYLLNKTTRAFGVRVSYYGSSRPNPFGETILSLFIIDKSSLRQVLKDYTISQSSGEWDTNCAGEFEDQTSSIDIDKIQTNNFNNLIIKTKIVKTKNIPTKDDCVAKESTKQATSKLIFDGKQYK